MTRTPDEAIAYVKSLNAKPAFETDLCKRKTREAFDIDSDGSKDATEAWGRTDHRVPATDYWRAGRFVWWTGGSNGHGHVAFTDTTPGYVWSVDIKRPGRWDRVKVETISATWPRLKLAGYSRDIEGVIPPVPKPKPTPLIDAAIKSTQAAIGERPERGPVRVQLEVAAEALRKARLAAQ